MFLLAAVAGGVVFVAGAAVGGYAVGKRRSEDAIIARMKTDPQFGKAILEYLAGVWGAKLEMFSPLVDSPQAQKG